MRRHQNSGDFSGAGFRVHMVDERRHDVSGRQRVALLQMVAIELLRIELRRPYLQHVVCGNLIGNDLLAARFIAHDVVERDDPDRFFPLVHDRRDGNHPAAEDVGNFL